MSVVRFPVASPLPDRGRTPEGFASRRAGLIGRLGRARRPEAAGPRPLSSLRAGESGIIVRIASASPERVVKLSSLGLMPGVRVTLVQKRPAVVLRVAETSIAIDGEVADDIRVEPIATDFVP